ncbi:MAG TPA: hypothetical protein VFG54_12145 [Prolixibacteraceae bacterium]|nr:hypothetical protein [Prolixibacteraceae bacterium]
MRNRNKTETQKLAKDFKMLEIINALWRDRLALYDEKYTKDPEKWKRNVIADEVEFGQAIGMDHIINGNQSVALGIGHTTTSYREMLMGSYATEMAGTADSWVATDRLWGLGNGVDGDNRNDALTVYKSGFMQMSNAIGLKAYEHGALPAPAGAMQYTALKGFEGYRDDVWQKFALIPSTVGAGILTLSGTGVVGSIVDNSGNWDLAFGWGNHAGLYAPASTVSFPGFGTSHTLAAYGDHNHDTVYQPLLPTTTGSYNKFLRIRNGSLSWTTRGFSTLDEAHWANYPGQLISKIYMEDGMVYGVSMVDAPSDTNYYPTDLSISGNNLTMSGTGMSNVSTQLFYSSGGAYGSVGYAARADHYHTFTDSNSYPTSMAVSGNNLQLTGVDMTAVSMALFAGNTGNYGTAATAARSNHTHPNDWNGGQVGMYSTSNYGVLNGADFDFIDGIYYRIKKDGTVTTGSELPVTSGAVYSALQGKASSTHTIQSHGDVYIPVALGAGNVNEALIWGGSSWNSGKPWTSAGYLTGITKAQVEAVLQGAITSHSHALASHSITSHSDVSFTYSPSSGDLMQYNGSAWTQRSIYSCGIAALAGSLSQQFSVLKLNLPGGGYIEVQGTTVHIYSGANQVIVHGECRADSFYKV